MATIEYVWEDAKIYVIASAEKKFPMRNSPEIIG